MSITIDGLVTGFDTTTLIEELLAIQRQPIKLVQAQVEDATAKKTAYLDVTANLLGLQQTANKLGSADLFANVNVTSADETVAVASGSTSLAPGSYYFQVAQLAHASQFASAGFASTDQSPIGAGTLAIDLGRGSLERATRLEELNGGDGIQRGRIRVTDRAGRTAIVDLTAALTVNDAIDAINNASGISVTARLATTGDAAPGRAIVIEDASGGTGTLAVGDVGGGRTALGLGIRASSATGVVQGGAILGMTETTRLSALNDGNGVDLAAGNDLLVTLKDGSSFSVDLGSARTVGDVCAAINAHAGITASLAADGIRLVIEDTSTAGGTTTIAEAGSGSTAHDLGIAGSFTTAARSGERVLGAINTTLLKELRGGTGIAAGAIQIVDRTGATAQVDLAGAETVADVLTAINAAGLGVEASLNRAGDGITLRDVSGGSGALSVAEVAGGTTAADLGILATAGVTGNELDGADAKFRYVSNSTRLNTLNGGAGIAAGSILITDSGGRSFKVNLAQEDTVGAVLRDINGAASAAGSDVVASINADGDGIMLASAGGSGAMRVDEVDGGTTARDLGLAGSAPAATPGVIDGSYERSIAISDTMTLQGLADAIDALDIGLTASVVNDGSADAPYRLYVTGGRSGELGRLTMHTTGTDAQFQTIAAAQDAVVLTGGGNPLLVRNSSNTFNDIVPGMTLTARSISTGPVEISVVRDDEKIADTIQTFVDDYNATLDKITELTRFDGETQKAALLVGDSTLRNITRLLSFAVSRPVTGSPNDANLSTQVGVRTGTKGKLVFSRSQFLEKLAADREDVEALFTAERKLDRDTKLAAFRNGGGVRQHGSGAEFTIHTRAGGTFTVDLAGATTVQGVINAINGAAGNSTVTAAIADDGRGFVLTDSAAGSGAFKVTALNSSPAFNDLGINKSADQPGGDTITGSAIDLTGDWGIGRRLYETLESLVNVDRGQLQLRADTMEKRITDLKERITGMEERITKEEERLRRQFAQLEVLMGEQQATLDRLNAAFGSLSKQSS